MKMIGTVTSYVNSLNLQHKAKEKMQNPLAGAKFKGLKAEPSQETISNRTMAIEAKLKSGQKLSAADMEFLRKHSPELYQKAVKVTKEREEYEDRLKRCRSKDEVRELHAQKSQQLVAEAKAVSNSNLPAGEKVAQMEVIGMRVAAIQNEHIRFVSTPEYQKLPDETEDKDDKKAKEKPSTRETEELFFQKSEEQYEDLSGLLAKKKSAESTPGKGEKPKTAAEPKQTSPYSKTSFLPGEVRANTYQKEA